IGSINFASASGNDGTSSITTIGGNVTQSAGKIDAFDLTCKSATGSFGTLASPLVISTRNLSFNTGTNAVASFANKTPLIVGVLTGNVTASKAGTVELQDIQTTILGPITATTTVTITDN